MSPILPALLLALACTAPPKDEPAMTSNALPVREGRVELTAKPVAVTLDVGAARAKVLEIARDPKRYLVLRVEGLFATKQPGVNWDVRVEGIAEPVGVLSLYGIEQTNGTFIAAFPIDEAARRALAGEKRALTIVFTPQSTALQGRVHFARLRLAEE